MKQQLTFLILIFSLGFLNAQLVINVTPSAGSAECEGVIPDLNSGFQNWLNSNAGASAQVGPSCSPSDLTWTNDYNPISSWSNNPCNNIATVQFCVSDCTDNLCWALTFEIINTSIPVWANGSCPPSSIFVSCGSDIPTMTFLPAIDQCEEELIIMGTESDQRVCENSGTLTRTWNLVDACGNADPSQNCVQTIQVGDASGSTLQWIDSDLNLPSDISFAVSQSACDLEIYNFLDCLWGNDANPSQQWPDPSTFLEGVHYESSGMCGDLTFTHTAGPCENIIPGTPFTVEYLLEDDCGNQLSHSFVIDLTCGNCTVGLGNFCATCEEATSPSNEGVCNSCDVTTLLNGFNSCTPPYDGMIQGPPQPQILCGGGVPNNMSWFSFVAGSEEIEISVVTLEGSCIPGEGGLLGVQVGIFDFCDGECLDGSTQCGGEADTLVISTADLIVGMTYHIFVDGCGGSECAYNLSILGQSAFELDDMESVIVDSNCDPPFEEENIFCSGQIINFNTLHDGTSVSDWGDYDAAGSTYSPDAELIFSYSFTPPLDGNSFESWDQLELDSQGTTPDIVLPVVSSPTQFTICIEEVIHQCDTAACSSGDCCIDITVQKLPNEVFALDVCVEDLLTSGGLDPSAAIADQGSSQFGWLGPIDLMFDSMEVVNNIIEPLSFTVLDPGCQCSFEQSIFINAIENCTSSNDESWENSFDVQFYPNPVFGELIIKSSESIDAVRISNKLGQVVQNIDWDKGGNSMSIDMSDLIGGVYFISFGKGNQTYTKKIIVLE